MTSMARAVQTCATRCRLTLKIHRAGRCAPAKPADKLALATLFATHPSTGPPGAAADDATVRLVVDLLLLDRRWAKRGLLTSCWPLKGADLPAWHVGTRDQPQTSQEGNNERPCKPAALHLSWWCSPSQKAGTSPHMGLPDSCRAWSSQAAPWAKARHFDLICGSTSRANSLDWLSAGDLSSKLSSFCSGLSSVPSPAGLCLALARKALMPSLRWSRSVFRIRERCFSNSYKITSKVCSLARHSPESSILISYPRLYASRLVRLLRKLGLLMADDLATKFACRGCAHCCVEEGWLALSSPFYHVNLPDRCPGAGVLSQILKAG